MKLCILVNQFPPRWLAGTEIATYNTARNLAKRGHEVHVITSLDKGMPKQGTEQGFYVHRIGRSKVRFIGAISFWLRMLLLTKKIGPDIVHSQDISMGVPGFLSKKLLKRPYIVWGRGADAYCPQLLMKPLSKLVLKNAGTAIALTRDMKEEMQRTCDRDVSVIPNGVDFHRFENLSREQNRSKLGIKQQEQIIMYVGRFNIEKGIKYLIQAMNIIRQEKANARLLLAGEGSEEESLKSLTEHLKLEGCADFLGKISNELVPPYMAAADVFVLPSFVEGFPNVLLEAMASGLPIVASKIVGLPEIISDGDNGFLVEPGSPEQIAEKVLLLLEDDKLREKISRNNKDKAKGYSWESVTDMLEEVYRRHV